jgi:hypothetical protein
MKKQILTIMVGAVVMLGAATTAFAGVAGFPGCDAFHVTCTGSTSR